AEAVETSHGFKLEWKKGLVGGAAIDAKGKALPDETVELCKSSTAVLFGSVGGPKWESLPPNEQPERAALLPLRKIFGLFANLRPAVLYPELTGCSPLRPRSRQIVLGIARSRVRRRSPSSSTSPPRARA
ncbi:MAG: hypothetical protein EBR52_08710, partial [Microbacteriaceae bacterium]|nr:hypothetical protein [Microbacteriaceae bacterium]